MKTHHNNLNGLAGYGRRCTRLADVGGNTHDCLSCDPKEFAKHYELNSCCHCCKFDLLLQHNHRAPVTAWFATALLSVVDGTAVDSIGSDCRNDCISTTGLAVMMKGVRDERRSRWLNSPVRMAENLAIVNDFDFDS